MRWLGDFWYGLKCRVWYRYNVVVCENLEATWCDRDELLFHSSFQILIDFIEKEKPWEFAGDVYSRYLECGEKFARERETTWKLIRELYEWYRYGHWNRCKYNEQTKRLLQLISIRGYLWT